jgi:hypothetical protein
LAPSPLGGVELAVVAGMVRTMNEYMLAPLRRVGVAGVPTYR